MALDDVIKDSVRLAETLAVAGFKAGRGEAICTVPPVPQRIRLK